MGKAHSTFIITSLLHCSHNFISEGSSIKFICLSWHFHLPRLFIQFTKYCSLSSFPILTTVGNIMRTTMIIIIMFTIFSLLLLMFTSRLLISTVFFPSHLIHIPPAFPSKIIKRQTTRHRRNNLNHKCNFSRKYFVPYFIFFF